MSYDGGVKRWVFTIILFLLLGAIVNIAVAWGCAIYPRGPDSFGSSPPGAYDHVDSSGNRTWLIAHFGKLHICQWRH